MKEKKGSSPRLTQGLLQELIKPLRLRTVLVKVTEKVVESDPRGLHSPLADYKPSGLTLQNKRQTGYL